MHAPGCLAGVYKVARNTLALLMIARTSLNLKKDLLNTIRGYEIEAPFRRPKGPKAFPKAVQQKSPAWRECTGTRPLVHALV
jgi:hypothetical protein